MADSNGLRLADREELRELRARYTHYWDDGLVEEWVQLFTEDCSHQAATDGICYGREALRKMAEANCGQMDFAIHFTGDEITEFTGEDAAKAVSRFAFYGGREPAIQGAGTYVDEYRKTPDGWRIHSRRQKFYFMGLADREWPATPTVSDGPYKHREG
jgi:hypothetical protein